MRHFIFPEKNELQYKLPLTSSQLAVEPANPCKSTNVGLSFLVCRMPSRLREPVSCERQQVEACSRRDGRGGGGAAAETLFWGSRGQERRRMSNVEGELYTLAPEWCNRLFFLLSLVGPVSRLKACDLLLLTRRCGDRMWGWFLLRVWRDLALRLDHILIVWYPIACELRNSLLGRGQNASIPRQQIRQQAQRDNQTKRKISDHPAVAGVSVSLDVGACTWVRPTDSFSMLILLGGYPFVSRWYPAPPRLLIDSVQDVSARP